MASVLQVASVKYHLTTKQHLHLQVLFCCYVLIIFFIMAIVIVITTVGTPICKAIIPLTVKYPIKRFISKIPGRFSHIAAPAAPTKPVTNDHSNETACFATSIISCLLS